VPDALDQIMKLKEQEDLGEIELGAESEREKSN
jgi:hypothetical protein